MYITLLKNIPPNLTNLPLQNCASACLVEARQLRYQFILSKEGTYMREVGVSPLLAIYCWYLNEASLTAGDEYMIVFDERVR